MSSGSKMRSALSWNGTGCDSEHYYGVDNMRERHNAAHGWADTPAPPPCPPPPSHSSSRNFENETPELVPHVSWNHFMCVSAQAAAMCDV